MDETKPDMTLDLLEQITNYQEREWVAGRAKQETQDYIATLLERILKLQDALTKCRMEASVLASKLDKLEKEKVMYEHKGRN